MARFIVIHQLAESAADHDFQDMRAARQHLFKLAGNPNLQWQRGWWVYEDAQQICEYEAVSKEAIERALREAGIDSLMPAVKIREVMLSGPSDFPGEFEA
jgi:hypothetical protein